MSANKAAGYLVSILMTIKENWALSGPPRRVVTGLDGHDRSCIIIDGPSDGVIWETGETPVSNAGNADRGGTFSFQFATGGTKFLIAELPPGEGLFGPAMHASNTIDYISILRGEVVLVTETGETRLYPGDVVVDRGVIHGWRCDGPEPVAMAIVMVDAAAVGPGATV